MTLTAEQINATQAWRIQRMLTGPVSQQNYELTTEFALRAADEPRHEIRFRTAGVNGKTPTETALANLADLSEYVPVIWQLFQVRPDRQLAHAEHGIVTDGRLDPEWFIACDAEYRKLGAHPDSIVAEPEQIEPMWASAYASADMEIDDPDTETDAITAGDEREHAVLTEAARRVAAAVAILAYGIDYPLAALTHGGGPMTDPDEHASRRVS